ncbi:hypothetical protein IP70_01115 [alpha proteobacterium AAP38]|nr:hypothetical protein IP70_01115 [alpha proteobacterium AAP38]
MSAIAAPEKRPVLMGDPPESANCGYSGERCLELIGADIFFKPGGIEALPDTKFEERLGWQGSMLLSYPDLKLVVIGYSGDDDGSDGANLALRRAGRVRDILIGMGIAPDRLRIAACTRTPDPGYGPSFTPEMAAAHRNFRSRRTTSYIDDKRGVDCPG